MTPENKRQNIKEELGRAAQSLAAADLLADGGFYSDAVSRLYYYLYHSSKALLLSIGLEPRSHEGLLRLVSMNFVKKGILSAQDSHTLSRMMKYREEADYNPSYVFDRRDYDDLRRETVVLSKKIEEHLSRGGFIQVS